MFPSTGWASCKPHHRTPVPWTPHSRRTPGTLCVWSCSYPYTKPHRALFISHQTFQMTNDWYILLLSKNPSIQTEQNLNAMFQTQPNVAICDAVRRRFFFSVPLGTCAMSCQSQPREEKISKKQQDAGGSVMIGRKRWRDGSIFHCCMVALSSLGVLSCFVDDGWNQSDWWLKIEPQRS